MIALCRRAASWSAREKHGFIWGGCWYHYDTMHFEYRPELLEIARRFGVSACR